MKPVTLFALLLMPGLALLTGCDELGAKGNGHVTTQSRGVGNFSAIELDGIFPVELSQDGSEPWVKVKTDENLQHLIQVQNDGDRLIIKSKDGHGIRRSTAMQIFINVKRLKEIEFKSVGNLNSTGTLKLDSLQLSASAVGKLDLDINADYLHADLNSVGSTTLSGKVREVRINNKSVGQLSAFGLKAGTLMIHNTAIGKTEIYADSAFYIRSSAIGYLGYKGPGTVKELTSEGIGKVKKEE
jgi:hypothetical protein